MTFVNNLTKISIREKCPNTEFFLVRIFLYSDQIKLLIWTLLPSRYFFYNAFSKCLWSFSTSQFFLFGNPWWWPFIENSVFVLNFLRYEKWRFYFSDIIFWDNKRSSCFISFSNLESLVILALTLSKSRFM